MAKPVSAPNLLELAPRRLVGSEPGADGRAVLLRPKFVRGPLAWWLQPRLRRRAHFKVHLDEIGSFVWERIDGATPVGVIADAARAHFGEAIEPVYERLRTFLLELEAGEFIEIPR